MDQTHHLPELQLIRGAHGASAPACLRKGEAAAGRKCNGKQRRRLVKCTKKDMGGGMGKRTTDGGALLEEGSPQGHPWKDCSMSGAYTGTGIPWRGPHGNRRNEREGAIFHGPAPTSCTPAASLMGQSVTWKTIRGWEMRKPEEGRCLQSWAWGRGSSWERSFPQVLYWWSALYLTCQISNQKSTLTGNKLNSQFNSNQDSSAHN